MHKHSPVGVEETAVRAVPRERLSAHFPERVGVILVLELGAVVVIHVHLVLVSTESEAKTDTAEGDVLPHGSAG